ncbi:MAG: hypothetical protein Q7K40_04720 [bacterium]|nr:hypothetical protein [bacterium]
MKTKLLILLGITLAVLSAFAVAGNLLTPPWSAGNVSPENTNLSDEKPEPPLVITKDLNVLKGRGLFYAENGSLHKEEISPDGTLATTSKIVATGSIRLVDQNDDAVLFVKSLSSGEYSSNNELWLLDKITGLSQKIINRVAVGGEGRISPQGNLIAVVTYDNELLLLARDGDGLVTQIGVHGISPMFSPDGKKIAYIKLKDEKINLGDEDMFQGVAIYDLVTGEDSIASKAGTEGKEYRITGWSPDGKRIYFPSSNDAIWSVALDGNGKRQETNNGIESPFVSTYLSQLLFADDGTTAFGEADGVWAFKLGNDGEFLGAKKVVEGVDGNISMLSWLEKGKSINFRPYGGVINPATGKMFPKAFTTVYRVSDLKQ